MLYDPKKWAMPEVPVRESEVVEVLKAAKLRTIQGWCNSGPSDEKGGVCIIVAIGRQANGISDGIGAEALSYFERAIQPPPKYSGPLSSIFGWFDPPEKQWTIDWNETPGRTKADVEAAFDRAIALARASD
jgi:hypothetical protein